MALLIETTVDDTCSNFATPQRIAFTPLGKPVEGSRSFQIRDGLERTGEYPLDHYFSFEAWVQDLEAVVDAAGVDRFPLLGISQGGAIALQAGLGYFRTLAGILALSTYLPLPDSLENAKGGPNAEIPIFLAHGSADPVVPVELGHGTRAQLDASGYEVEWHEYQGMPHSVSEKEIYHIAEWIEKVLM